MIEKENSEWKKFLNREEFLQLYFEKLHINEMLKIQRFVNLHDITKTKSNQKFLFGIVKTVKNNFITNTSVSMKQKVEKIIRNNKIILMVN